MENMSTFPAMSRLSMSLKMMPSPIDSNDGDCANVRRDGLPPSNRWVCKEGIRGTQTDIGIMGKYSCVHDPCGVAWTVSQTSKIGLCRRKSPGAVSLELKRGRS